MPKAPPKHVPITRLSPREKYYFRRYAKQVTKEQREGACESLFIAYIKTCVRLEMVGQLVNDKTMDVPTRMSLVEKEMRLTKQITDLQVKLGISDASESKAESGSQVEGIFD